MRRFESRRNIAKDKTVDRERDRKERTSDSPPPPQSQASPSRLFSQSPQAKGLGTLESLKLSQ